MTEKKKCPVCGHEMVYIPKGECNRLGCKDVIHVWFCLECGKELKEEN